MLCDQYVQYRECILYIFNTSKISCTNLSNRFNIFCVAEKGTPPQFVIKIKTKKVKEGEKADFNCKVIGHPTPELTWFFNDEPIEGQGRYTLVEREDLQVGHRFKSRRLWVRPLG